MQFGLAELGLKGVDPGAEIVGQGPGCVFLKAERLEEGGRGSRADRLRIAPGECARVGEPAGYDVGHGPVGA